MVGLISDAHVHLGKSEAVGHELTIEDVLWHKEHNTILNMLVMDPDNDNMLKLLDKKIWGIRGLQWITESTAPDDLIHTENVIGCKFHGAYGNRPRPSLAILEQLNRFGALLLMHTGRYKDADISSNSSYLHSVEIGKQYPDIILIMAHMGGTDTTICKRAINASQDYKNIYFDTSGITTPYIIEYACDTIGPQRILFGSDVPWCSFRAMYYTIEDARIPEVYKDDILYHNLNRLVT